VFKEFYAVYAETNLQAGPSRKQPLSLYRDHVPASFKTKLVREITRADIFPWLLRLLQAKHETGRRLRSLLERIFEYAINCGYVDANPTPSRRAFEIKKPKAKSHGTLDYTRLPELWRWLDGRQFMPQTKMAIRLLILSAHRVGVVLAAKWEHFDLQTGIWTVPERTDNETPGLMKSGRAHSTTLPKSFLNELMQLRGNSPYLFPSDSVSGYVTENAVLKALQEFDSTITAHGFRNTFKTWARSEGVPDWVADAYVDHSLKGLDRSYRREDAARVVNECAKLTEGLYQYVRS
jgi:integrase